MKRIRYYKIMNDNIASENLMAGNEVLTIILYPLSLKFTVFNSQGESLIENSAISLQMLKKKAKNAAIKLGVTFESEFRPRIKLGESK